MTNYALTTHFKIVVTGSLIMLTYNPSFLIFTFCRFANKTIDPEK